MFKIKINIYKTYFFLSIGFKISKFSIKFIKSWIKARRLKNRKVNKDLITIYEDL